MKIDFIISGLLGGGAERVMALLINHLSEKGYDIGLITFNPGSAYNINNNVRRIDLHKGRFKNHTLRSFLNLFKYYRKNENRPDIMVSFITQINLIAILIAKIYKIPVIGSEHNSHLRSQRPVYITKYTRDFVYPLANYITVLTAFDIEFYSKKKVNVVVMPNPCTFEPLQETVENRDKVILAVGNLDRFHHKGFDNLIDIAAMAIKEHPDWVLKIVGGGEKGTQHLKEKAAKMQIENQVVFAGFQNNVSEIMKGSEIFILSSRFEGLPMVLLEAMSQGMTCIAYDCKTGPSDIITDGENGLLIEDQNMEKMIQGLHRLMNKPELRYKLAQAGVSSLEKFSMATVISKWEKLFNELKA